jgi:hypothetical protein
MAVDLVVGRYPDVDPGAVRPDAMLGRMATERRLEFVQGVGQA